MLAMENYGVSFNLNKEVHHFEVGEYLHHDGQSCKFKVFREGKFVVSFQPDEHHYLHICLNPGQLKEEFLYLLAEQIEAHHPHGIRNTVKDLKL